jgi:hypothetical protein
MGDQIGPMTHLVVNGADFKAVAQRAESGPVPFLPGIPQSY